MFHRGATRLFYVRPGRTGLARTYYVCSRRLRRAVVFYRSNPERDGLVAATATRFTAFGRRVGFERDDVSEFQEYIGVGWVDVMTGREREIVPNSADIGFNSIGRFVVGDDGGVALLLDRDSGGDYGSGQLIAYASAGRTRLGTPKVIAQVPAADIVPSSLAIVDHAVTWTTKSGARGTAPIPAAGG